MLGRLPTRDEREKREDVQGAHSVICALCFQRESHQDNVFLVCLQMLVGEKYVIG